jgi:hypothetical protein
MGLWTLLDHEMRAIDDRNGQASRCRAVLDVSAAQDISFLLLKTFRFCCPRHSFLLLKTFVTN